MQASASHCLARLDVASILNISRYLQYARQEYMARWNIRHTDPMTQICPSHLHTIGITGKPTMCVNHKLGTNKVDVFCMIYEQAISFHGNKPIFIYLSIYFFFNKRVSVIA